MDYAFSLPGMQPMTPALLVGVLKAALIALGCPYAQAVTAHSLRRGGVHAAVAAGAPRQDIKSHGTWKTDSAFAAYTPQQFSTKVASSLASLFAK